MPGLAHDEPEDAQAADDVSSDTRYVAFLRAVNVGQRRVAMARLREVVEGLGFGDVVTYVNSGNVAFSTSVAAERLEQSIESVLEAAFGFAVPTFVRSGEDLARITARRPFGDIGRAETHLVVLLRDEASESTRLAAEALSNDTDRLAVVEREVHWLIAGNVMDSSLTPKQWRTLGEQLTTSRNTTMLTKLVARLAGADGRS